MTTEHVLREVNLEDAAMTYAARVLNSDQRRTVPALQTAEDGITVSFAAGNEAMLEVLRANHTLDDEILTEAAPPYFWPAEISSTRRDSFDTAMDPATTLRNFVEDLIAGVSFCDSHNHEELPFGRSFAGIFIEGVDDATGTGVVTPARVVGALYTLPGLKLNRVNTDDLIRGMRGGIVKDVSVGFKPRMGFMYRCSICARDMMRDWDCEHIPGFKYETTVEGTGETVERYAFAWVVNAGLSEVSGAYDGATPQAMILKARLEAASGRLPPKMARMIEARCRIQLPKKSPQLSGTDDEGRRTDVADDKTKLTDEQRLEFVRSVLNELKFDKTEADKATTADAGVRILQAEVTRLRAIEPEHTLLRTQLIDSTLAEGVRAIGKDFDEAKQRTLLDKLGHEDIETMRASYKQTADNKLGGGKRKTTDDADLPEDEDEDGQTRAADDYLPEDAFAGA